MPAKHHYLARGQSLQCCRPCCLCPACHGYPASTPSQGIKMHKGSTNPRLTQELRSATVLALRVTEITARSLEKAMYTLVVQESYLWLSLVETSNLEKVCFLDASVFQAGLFGDTVEDCAQQFSAVQKQREAIQHILHQRDALFANCFLCIELDSVSVAARLNNERAQSMLTCLSLFRGRMVVPLKNFQRLLGHMASEAAVLPLGLFHMGPLQHRLHYRVPRWACRRGTVCVANTLLLIQPLDGPCLSMGRSTLEQVYRHIVVTMDPSSAGWCTTCNGQAASRFWTGPRLIWHINCLELLAVLLVVQRVQPA